MLSLILVLLDEAEADRFNALYYHTQRAALNMAYAILKDNYDAEEAVQEAFLRVAMNMENIEDPQGDRAKNYVLKVTKHRALTFLERRNRREEEAFDENAEMTFVGDRSAEDRWLDEEQYRLLIACIRKMKEPYQTVLYFHLVEYMETKEIAALLEKKLNTIQQQVIRGRQLLREIVIKEVLGDE